MGYHTEFEGHFNISPQIKPEHAAYINKFSETRRMKRNPELLKSVPDPIRKAVGLSLGPDGCYFVGGSGFCGQDKSPDVIEYNYPPQGQPGLWCKWEVLEDLSRLQWNGAEKFYDYVEWLEYLIKHFFEPGGYSLTGTIRWSGEEVSDVGKIHCNVVNGKTIVTTETF